MHKAIANALAEDMARRAQRSHQEEQARIQREQRMLAALFDRTSDDDERAFIWL